MPTILVVEDNEACRTVVARLLEKKNYKVLLAGDGRQAVAIARAEQPDLILMDLELPEVDGWQAISQLKSDRNTEHIPIIVLTGHSRPNDRHQALAAGGDDFDTKPVEFSRLMEKMERLLARHEQ